MVTTSSTVSPWQIDDEDGDKGYWTDIEYAALHPGGLSPLPRCASRGGVIGISGFATAIDWTCPDLCPSLSEPAPPHTQSLAILLGERDGKWNTSVLTPGTPIVDSDGSYPCG